MFTIFKVRLIYGIHSISRNLNLLSVKTGVFGNLLLEILKSNYFWYKEWLPNPLLKYVTWLHDHIHLSDTIGKGVLSCSPCKQYVAMFFSFKADMFRHQLLFCCIDRCHSRWKRTLHEKFLRHLNQLSGRCYLIYPDLLRDRGITWYTKWMRRLQRKSLRVAICDFMRNKD